MDTEIKRSKTASLLTVCIYLVFCLLAMPDSGGAQAAKLRMSEEEALRLLASDELGERDRALLAAMELEDRAGPELRAAVIRAAWEEMKGQTGRHPESDAYITYIHAVAGLRDPAAIPFLVEHGGSSMADELADFGELAFPAIMQKAMDRRLGLVHQGHVSNAIKTLRFMVEDGSIRPEELAQVRRVVHMRITEPDQGMGTICRAATLAVVLGDADLVALVEQLAGDRSAVVALLSDHYSDGLDLAVSYVQNWAQDRLAGVPLEGNFVRRKGR